MRAYSIFFNPRTKSLQSEIFWSLKPIKAKTLSVAATPFMSLTTIDMMIKVGDAPGESFKQFSQAIKTQKTFRIK